MENEFILVKEQLPEKGKNIIGIDKDGNKHYCFRCACHNPNCKEWRCSLTGGGLIIDVVKWIYEPMLGVVLCPDCFGDGIKTKPK